MDYLMMMLRAAILMGLSLNKLLLLGTPVVVVVIGCGGRGGVDPYPKIEAH